MSKTIVALLSTILLSSALAGSTLYAAGDLGYKDTPMLPGGKWHVHDPDRPMAPVVKPAATFSQGAPAAGGCRGAFRRERPLTIARSTRGAKRASDERPSLPAASASACRAWPCSSRRGQNQHSQQHDTAERCAHSRLGRFKHAPSWRDDVNWFLGDWRRIHKRRVAGICGPPSNNSVHVLLAAQYRYGGCSSRSSVDEAACCHHKRSRCCRNRR
jgi:hypothetical protein